MPGGQRHGLRAKLAVDKNGVVGGMIQYLPIEHSFVEGSDLYMIHCIWVHGHKQGRGNFQKRSMGKALLAAAEEDARQRGAKGMAAWGISDAILVDGKRVQKGPPPSYERIRKIIEKRVVRL